MEHAGGATRAVPVPSRATPFDVDVGPDRHGGTLAVYSRCACSIRFDLPTPPLGSRRHGCDLYRYSFTTGRASAIARANSGGDETWPAVWRSRIAFVRTYPGRRGRAGKVQHLLSRSLDAPGRAQPLRRPSPVVTVRESTPEATTVSRRRLPFVIEWLDLRGRTAAYTWKRVDDLDTVSFVYLSTTGGDLRPAARGATFGGGAADTSRTLRDATLGADGVDWLFESRGAPHYFGSFLRRSAGGAVRRSPSSKAVAFACDAGTAHWIDGGPGAEFDPESQPGGTFALRADDAVPYRPVPRSWLPIPPP